MVLLPLPPLPPSLSSLLSVPTVRTARNRTIPQRWCCGDDNDNGDVNLLSPSSSKDDNFDSLRDAMVDALVALQDMNMRTGGADDGDGDPASFPCHQSYVHR